MRTKILQSLLLVPALLIGLSSALSAVPDTGAGDQDKRHVYFVADGPSHGYGEHDHKAGTHLLANHLEKGVSGVETTVYTGGWPDADDAFKDADAIAMYCNGGGGHVAMGHLDQLDRLAKNGVGIVALHYAVEVPTGKPGSRFQDWIGGHFETHHSVNPHWTINADDLPDHPIARGVSPFQIHDEWYYHMRFREGMTGITPIIQDLPPKNTLLGRGWKPGKDSTPHHGNADVWNAVVEQKQPQVTAWATERDNAGRGFGFTGGHYHKNWAHDQFRRLVLNGIAWAAHVTVPDDGIRTETPTVEELEANHNENGSYNEKKLRQQIAMWNTLNTNHLAFESDLVTPETEGNGVNVEVSVKDANTLYLVARPGPDGSSCDWVTWARPRLITSGGDTIKLTDLDWKSATSGWASVRKNKNVGGDDMSIDGASIPYGIGAHAASVISYDLPDGVETFKTFAGLDDGGVEQGCGSTVKFRVYVD